jgi:hypothetical protein
MNSRKIFLLISHKKVVSNRNIITKRLCIIWKFVFPCFSQSFCCYKALDDICGEEIYCLGHIMVILGNLAKEIKSFCRYIIIKSNSERVEYDYCDM